MLKFVKDNKVVVLLVVLILVAIFFTFQKTEFGFYNQAKVSDIEEIKTKVSDFGFSFIKNQGQIKSETVEFYTSTPVASVFVLKDGLTYSIEEKNNKKNIREVERLADSLERSNRSGRKGFAFNEKFVDFNPEVEIVAENPSEATLTHFKNNAKAEVGNYSYEYLNYKNLWKDINLELHLNASSLEKIFKIQPGGNPENIKLKLEGPENLSITSSGDLSIVTPISNVSMTAPVAYQIDASGQRHEVSVAYKIIDDNTYTFEVGDYDLGLELVIDPLLAGTVIPNGEYMTVADVEVDNLNNIYVTGYIDYLFFPTTVGAWDTTGAEGDYLAFVSKFSPDMSTLIASTLLGESQSYVYNLVFDKDGNVVVAGTTDNSSFPTTPGAYDTTFNGGQDGFISILNSNLTELLYSTFLGGSEYDYLKTVDVDSAGKIFVTGHTPSSDFPTVVGSYDTTFGGGEDPFVSKFSSDLSSLEASTLFGGAGSDQFYSLAINDSDEIYVYGISDGAGLASTTAYQTEQKDLFIAKFSNDLSTYMAGTYFGGDSGNSAYDLIIDGSGNVIVSGLTYGDLPVTPGAYDTISDGDADLFISILNSDLTGLIASTFLGGQGEEELYTQVTPFNNLAIDSNGDIIIMCSYTEFTYNSTWTTEYPTTPGAFMERFPYPVSSVEYNVSGPAISKFSSDLSVLKASTVFSGVAGNLYHDGIYYQGGAMTLDNDDNIVFGGVASDVIYYPDVYLPITQNAFSKVFSQDGEGYLAKLDNNLSAGINHLVVRGKNTLYFENFNDSSSSLPAGFTTGGDANWSTEGSVYDSEIIIDKDSKNVMEADNQSPILVFVDKDKGYHFVVRTGDGVLAYRKTSDGGLTWSKPIVIDSLLSWDQVSIWYDGWTPENENGTLVHIVATSDDATAYYTYLDTENDSLKGDMVSVMSGNAGSSVFKPSIVKNSEGNIFISASFSNYSGSASGVVAKSEDSGATWTPRNDGWTGNVKDQIQLLPLKTNGDVLAIRADTVNNDLDYQIYDETTDAWSGSWVTVTPLVDANSSGSWFSGTVKKSSGDIYLSLVNNVGNATNDIEFWTFGDVDRAWNQGTNVVNDNDWVKLPTTLIDEASGDIYVIYARNTSGSGWDLFNAFFDIYFKVSTDGGTTWSAESFKQSVVNGSDRTYAIRGGINAINPFVASYNEHSTYVSDYSIFGLPLANSSGNLYYSAKSGPISDNEETYLDTSYTFDRPGNIEFRSKIDTEGSPYDVGLFCIDNKVNCNSIKADFLFSGLEYKDGWTHLSFPVSAGLRDFRWKYVKNYTDASGEDAFWIDDVKFTEYVNSTTTSVGATTTIWFEAQDSFNNLEGSYYYDKTLTLSGPSTAGGVPTCTDKDGVAVPFGNPTTLTFAKGRASCDAIFYTPETVLINATDGTYNSNADSSYGLTLTIGESGGGSTPTPSSGGGSGSRNTSVFTITNDPSTPDAIAANDPEWKADYKKNAELLNRTFEEDCRDYSGLAGWYGRYFDYPASHPDMEVPSLFWSYEYGDPLSQTTPWKADWYDDKYFKFGKVDPNLKFGSSYFPFDYAPEEYTQGHSFYFGAMYSSKVSTSQPGDYALRISSDDDSWVYLDGKLVVDNHGIHGAHTKTANIHLSDTHLIQVFFAERHTIQSHLYFTIDDPNSTLTYEAFLDGCKITPTPPTPPTPPQLPEDFDAPQSTDNVVSNTEDNAKGSVESDDIPTPEETEDVIIPEVSKETETPDSDSQSPQSQEVDGKGISFDFSQFLDWFAKYPAITNIVTLVSLLVIAPITLVLQFPIILETISRIKSFSDFWMVISRSWLQLLSFLGLRKKKRYWGTVYDSQSKQPLDPALVQLVDAETRKPIEQCFTDLWGRFGFIAPPGRYYLTANKTHYQFPSTKETGSSDGIFDNLYHGEIIEIKNDSEIVNPNIPMDPLGYDWNQEAKQKYVKFHPVRDLLVHWVSAILFWFGFFFTILACFTNPVILNKILLVVYIFVVLIRFFLPKGRLWGRVFSKTDSTLLPGLNLELNHENLKEVILGRTRASLDGKFFLKAEPGRYVLSVKDPETKAVLAQSEIKVGKNKVVNDDVWI